MFEVISFFIVLATIVLICVTTDCVTNKRKRDKIAEAVSKVTVGKHYVCVTRHHVGNSLHPVSLEYMNTETGDAIVCDPKTGELTFTSVLNLFTDYNINGRQ